MGKKEICLAPEIKEKIRQGENIENILTELLFNKEFSKYLWPTEEDKKDFKKNSLKEFYKELELEKIKLLEKVEKLKILLEDIQNSINKT